MASDPVPAQTSEESTQTFAEAILGKGFVAWVDRFKVAPERLFLGAVVGFAFLIFVPYLGAVGLWDPWETHYGEVGRMMIQRNDYVHPYWENAWFFSKPAFTMWMQAFGMQLVGTNRTDGALALYTEWGFRLPFVAFSMVAVGLLALALARTVSKRVGLAAAFVLCTMPLYFLLTRQAVTDTPGVAALVSAMACAIIGQFDETAKHRAGWWYAFYVFSAIGVLAKGFMGVMPPVIFVLYLLLAVAPWSRDALEEHWVWAWNRVFVPALAGAATAIPVIGGYLLLLRLQGRNPAIIATEQHAATLACPVLFAALAVMLYLLRRGEKKDEAAPPLLWRQLYEMRLGTGLLVFLAVCGGWFSAMFAFDGLDDEGKLFWYRFIMHDHLARLSSGVHTTTPGGDFTYFILQGGFSIFPWVALVPGAFSLLARLRFRAGDKRDQVTVLAVVWLVLSFWLIGSSATKFHHYVFPMLPPLAVLIGLFIDRVWSEGLRSHGPALAAGAPLFALVGKDLAENPKNFTDLFVYNYDRPYPTELVTRPVALTAERSLWMGDLLGIALLGAGAYVAAIAFNDKSKPVYLRWLGITLPSCGLSFFATVWTRGAVSPTLLVGLSLLLGVLYLAYEKTQHKQGYELVWLVGSLVGFVGLAMVIRGGMRPAAQDALVRWTTDAVNLKTTMGFAFLASGVAIGIAALARSKIMTFGLFWALACGFALWFNWSHWVDLSHHWTQRDLFWRYFKLRKPGEPIVAFLMNWRGETFYSKNTVKQIKDNGLLTAYANQPGREWALVEHNRLGILKSAVGSDKAVTLIDKDINNKFVLVTIE